MHLRLSLPLLRYVLVLTAALLGLALPTAADGERASPAEGAKSFPTFKGKLLTGESFSTEKLRGKPHLVVVGFERAHAKELRAWAQTFKQSFPDEARSDYFQIVAMPGQIAVMRGFIHKQMVRNSPEAARARIMTVFAADSLCKQLEIKDRKVVYVFVMDRESRITHREEGEFTEAGFARVKEKLLAAGVSSLEMRPETGKQPNPG